MKYYFNIYENHEVEITDEMKKEFSEYLGKQILEQWDDITSTGAIYDDIDGTRQCTTITVNLDLLK